MGNTQQQKYFSIQDAVDALGNEKWNFIRNRLSRSTNAPLDFATFYNILTTKFQQMVRILCFLNFTVHFTDGLSFFRFPFPLFSCSRSFLSAA